MRAIAAFAVFGCHLVAYWHLQGRLPLKLTPISELGAHGVDLFVVISGFCLALPVARAGQNLQTTNFFIRRAARILPPYYLALAACAALAIIPRTAQYVVGTPAGAKEVLTHALFIQSLVPGEGGAINGSFWSVALEVQLYLLFPIVVLCWRRFGIERVLVATALMSVAWSVGVHAHGWVLGSNEVIPDRLAQFVAGVLAANLVASGRIPSRRLLWSGLLVGGVVAALASNHNVRYESTLIWTVPSFCAVLLGCNAFENRAHGRALIAVGVWSYSFYLLQQPVLLLTSPVAHKITNSPMGLLLLGCTVCLALVIGGSWLMYHLVERPSIDLGARWIAARRARQAETAPAVGSTAEVQAVLEAPIPAATPTE